MFITEEEDGIVITDDGGIFPDYYVSPDGDDEHGDGSRERPWRTLGYAFTVVPAGSVVQVPPGTYPPFHQDVRIVAKYPPTDDPVKGDA